ncbi:MAG: magnesium transporter CorA family protein [Candidatus Thorarchaeota archaeon]|jgi:magnesium transporter|nr:magnesium transporter CorA family protein [Candidatus Thorarchaeota archaeon]
MSGTKKERRAFTIIELESGIKHDSLDAAPDVPLLIDLVDFSLEDLAKISQRFEIDLEDLQDVQDLDERPRLQIEDKYTMLILRVPVNLEVEERPYSTYPIGVFTNGRDIIIVKNQLVPLRKDRVWLKLRNSTTPNEVIYYLWDTIIKSFEYTLDIVESTINNMEDRLLAELYPSQLDRFFQLSRDTIFMEAALKANMKVLRRLKRVHMIGKMALDTDRLEELEVDLEQQMGLSAIYRDLINNAMNAYDSIVGHNLSKVMKTLTVISLVVSVPTLIASLYGMNVGLPLESDPFAFVIITLFSLIITVPLLFYLKFKKLV